MGVDFGLTDICVTSDGVKHSADGLNKIPNIGKRFEFYPSKGRHFQAFHKRIVGSWLNGFKAKRELTPKLLTTLLQNLLSFLLKKAVKVLLLRI